MAQLGQILSRPRIRRLWRWLPHVLVGLIAVPFIIRQNSWYEWSNALWLLELQTEHVRAFGTPSYFIDAAGMLFYPQQLFYAGPMFSVLAYPALLVGAWPVFAFTAAAAFCAMSAGVSWTARNLGASPDLAVLPGVLFAVTPYSVSNLYGRGDWAELVAIGALSVAIGAGSSLVLGRARSVFGTMTVLALAVAAVAGTHNITLLFGGIFAVLLGFALLPIVRGTVLKCYGAAAAGAAVGVALCGEFIVPDAWLSNQTYIAGVSSGLLASPQLRGFDHLSVLFDPLTGQAPGAAGTFLHTETLVAGTAWCVIALAWATWRRWLDRRTALTIALVVLIAVAAVALMIDPDWWLHFPQQLQAIQFPFRLVSYLALATVLLVAVLLGRSAVATSRVLVSLLGVAVVLQVGLGGYLAVSAQRRPVGVTPAPTPTTITARVTPASYPAFQQTSYRILRGHLLATPPVMAATPSPGEHSPSEVHLHGSQPAGTLLATNIVATPLIRVSGGAWLDGTSTAGFAVLRVLQTPWKDTVSPKCAACLVPGRDNPPALTLGHWASLLGALALLGLLAGAAQDWRRVRAIAHRI